MFTAAFLLAVLGPIAFILGYGVYDVVRKRQRALAYRKEVSALPAFTDDIDIRKLADDPEGYKARLTGLVVQVHVVSEAQVTPDGVDQRYNCFVLDTAGEAHDVQTSSDADDVATNGQWLAELLGATFHNETSGYPDPDTAPRL